MKRTTLDLQQAYDTVRESYGPSNLHTQGVDPQAHDVVSEQGYFDPAAENQRRSIPELKQLRDNAHAGISYLTKIVDEYINGQPYSGETSLEEDLGLARAFFETACNCRDKK